MTNTLLVRFWSDGYAPCMVQGKLVNRRLRERVARHVEANGGGSETTFLLSWDDAECSLPARALRALREGWDVTVRMDAFEALTMYGYDANTLRA